MITNQRGLYKKYHTCYPFVPIVMMRINKNANTIHIRPTEVEIVHIRSCSMLKGKVELKIERIEMEMAVVFKL